MRLSKGVKQLAADILDPETTSGEEIREQLLTKARAALIEELDLRKQDKGSADALLTQGCEEIHVGWRAGKVQAYLEYAAGTEVPPVPSYCGDCVLAAAKIARALEKVGVDLIDRELYAVREDEVITRDEAGEQLIEAIAEARNLLFLLGSLDGAQVEALKPALTHLIGALKTVGNTGELLAIIRQLASHDAQ